MKKKVSYLSNENDEDIFIPRQIPQETKETLNSKEIRTSAVLNKNDEVIEAKTSNIEESISHTETDEIKVGSPQPKPPRKKISLPRIPGCGCLSNIYSCFGCLLLIISVLIIAAVFWVNF